jgi:outer membrane protein OmpA-like peptidoglycan-associated protein
MRSSIRVLLVAVLAFFMMTAAFAEDDASPVKKATDTSATAPATTDTSATTTQPATTTPTPAPAPLASSSGFRSDNTPMIEVFGGFSYLRSNLQGGLFVPPCTALPCNPFNVSNGPFNSMGLTGAVTWNVRDWLGLTADFGGYGIRELNPGVKGSYSTFLFGPTFSSHKSERWTPFVHVLLGADRLGASNAGISTHQNAFAAAFGGGFDVSLNRLIAVRVIQAEYLITKFNDGAPVGSGKNRQDGGRLSAGIVFRFGYPKTVVIQPAPTNSAPIASCSANPNMVTAGSGDIVIVRANASDPDNDPLTYSWSATGGNVAGSGSEVRWNSGGVAPGTYTVTASVNDGHSHTVNCSADITVNPPPNRKPIVSCSASKNSVVSGEPVGIRATASDPDGDPLTYSWSTSTGRITGSGASVQLDTTNAQGAATVTATVDDGRGGTASCSTTVDVRPRSLSLRSVYFVVGQPTKKNPDGGLLPSQQQTLQTVARDFKSYLSVKPDARLMLDGYADIRKYAGGKDNNDALTARRSNRAKNYLVEQGVSASNLDTNSHGDHQQLTEAQVKALVESSPELSAEEKARMLSKKNFHMIWLANNRRVDATLESTGQTSVQEYPFNAADALTLIGGREAEYVKKHPPKKAPVKKAPAKKAAPKKAATKK